MFLYFPVFKFFVFSSENNSPRNKIKMIKNNMEIKNEGKQVLINNDLRVKRKSAETKIRQRIWEERNEVKNVNGE